ncbi:hypothetical protein HYC85_025628 [Camellia sinensis]|uniref:Strictosidine synthase conserved region domain-containing protein n=1 Tax=Camellia sinensis TaxID=4442 RepID=A0A7J7GBJ3_CAMSI|nr:hypothetical protein HYC85_025628 [Camellia sinensis]
MSRSSSPQLLYQGPITTSTQLRLSISQERSGPKVLHSVLPAKAPTPASPTAGFSSGKEMTLVGLTLLSPLHLGTSVFRPFAPEMEHVCGRPLGLRFDKKTGDLYIADAYFGLQVVGPNGGLATQLVAEVEGQPLRFTNDMDIDEHQDVIYFTDTSTSFHRRQFMSSILSGDKTGRLMKYDKSSKEVTILLRGLAFANGVALSTDHSFVLVAETTTCKILRLWLHGPNAGNSDIFAELPGFPDNVRRNSKGEFWVALHSKKGLLADWVVSNTWVGKSLLKLPLSFKQLHYLLVGGKPHATAIKLSEKGEILEVLEDSEGKSLRFISEVEEKNGKLWIGSVMMPFIGFYNR